ncbi:MAG: hypothetical protein ACOZNI_16270 [Myxococcota bacterium]
MPEADSPRDADARLNQFRAEVGHSPDAEVADRAGVSVADVKAYRRAHGIAPYRRPLPASPPAESVTAPPVRSEAARTVVLRRRTHKDGAVEVVVHRPFVELVADAQPTPPPVAPAPISSPLEAYVAQLGTTPDAELAVLAGASVAAVQQYRRRRGIAPAQRHAPKTPTLVTPAKASPARTPRASKLDAFLDLVGQLPDAEVAARAGVTPEAVRLYRTRRGIPRPEFDGRDRRVS